MSINRKFYIAGVQFRPNAKEIIAKELEEGMVLTLVPEPDNKFDPNAVKVVYGEEHLGYVPKALAPEIVVALELNEPLLCVASKVDPVAKPWEMCEVQIKTLEDEVDEDQDDELLDISGLTTDED